MRYIVAGDQPLLTSARLIGLTGALLVMVGLTAGVVWALLNAPFDLGPAFILVVQALIAALVVRWIFLYSGPHALLCVLLLAFLGSFAVGFGWYFLLFLLYTPFGLVGVGILLYLIAAAFSVAPALAGSLSREGDQRREV